MLNHKENLVEVIERLNRIYHNFRNEINKELMSRDIPLSKVRILNVVENIQSCIAKDIINELGYTSRSVTEALDSLESEGYVVRTKDKGNRKIKILSLTELGKETLIKAMNTRNEKLNSLLSPLSEEQLCQLDEIMKKLYNDVR